MKRKNRENTREVYRYNFKLCYSTLHLYPSPLLIMGLLRGGILLIYVAPVP